MFGLICTERCLGVLVIVPFVYLDMFVSFLLFCYIFVLFPSVFLFAFQLDFLCVYMWVGGWVDGCGCVCMHFCDCVLLLNDVDFLRVFCYFPCIFSFSLCCFILCVYMCGFLHFPCVLGYLNLYDFCFVAVVIFSPLIFVWGSESFVFHIYVHFIGDVFFCKLWEFAWILNVLPQYLCVCLHGLVFAACFLIDKFMY